MLGQSRARRGQDCVHSNAMTPQFSGGCASQAGYGSCRGSEARLVRCAEECRRRAGDEQAAALALLDQGLAQVSDEAKGPFEMHVDQGIEVFVSRSENRALSGDAGGIETAIE